MQSRLNGSARAHMKGIKQFETRCPMNILAMPSDSSCFPPCRELRFVTAIWPPSHRSFLGALETGDWRSWNRFIKRKQGPDLRYLWWGYLERVIFWICSDLGFLKPFLATSWNLLTEEDRDNVRIFSIKVFEALWASKWPQRPDLTLPSFFSWQILVPCQVSDVLGTSVAFLS